MDDIIGPFNRKVIIVQKSVSAKVEHGKSPATIFPRVRNRTCIVQCFKQDICILIGLCRPLYGAVM